MNDVTSAPIVDLAAEQWEKRALAELAGRIGISVDGKIVAVLEVAGGRAKVSKVEPGALRATLGCRSLDEFRAIAGPKVNWMVAALRGRLAVNGDLTYVLKVIRALRTTLPIDWAIEQSGKGG
jgi:SCP-2 sterol transfer family